MYFAALFAIFSTSISYCHPQAIQAQGRGGGGEGGEERWIEAWGDGMKDRNWGKGVDNNNKMFFLIPSHSFLISGTTNMSKGLKFSMNGLCANINIFFTYKTYFDPGKLKINKHFQPSHFFSFNCEYIIQNLESELRTGSTQMRIRKKIFFWVYSDIRMIIRIWQKIRIRCKISQKYFCKNIYRENHSCRK